MRRFFAALFFTALGGGLVYFAFTYHVVFAAEGLLLVPKHQASLADTYADVREWTVTEWQDHGLLARSLAKHGRTDVIVEPAANTMLRDFFDGFRGTQPDRE